jgi:hypothetical protein
MWRIDISYSTPTIGASSAISANRDMKLSMLTATTVLLCFCSAYCQAGPLLDGIAAVVHNEVITFAQVREMTADAEAKARLELPENALPAKLKDIRCKALADLIERKRAEQGMDKAR